jgi:transmembrane sensor
MSEPSTKLDAALQHVAPEWDDARTTRTLAGMAARRAKRRARTAALAGGCALLAIGVASALSITSMSSTANVPANAAAAPWRQALEFTDGSRAFVSDDRSQVVVARAEPAVTEVTLARGRARFVITPNRERRFRVIAGDVEVEVLGTIFDVERFADGTRVEVERGRVAVSWPGGRTELAAGEARLFGRSERARAATEATRTLPNTVDVESEPEVSSVKAEGAEPRAAATRAARANGAQNWRQHAEQGDFNRAFALLTKERTRVADDVEELLLAADAARLSGHATQALPYLRKVVEVHDRDPRAPLAAFTLGSVLMHQLGRPREAEAAYARARALSPGGSLAQDALARQVEAAHRAGDTARAGELALEYIERYPDGRRVQAVRRFGNLP